MKPILTLLILLTFLTFLSPPAHAYTYTMKGGSVRINLESIDKENLDQEIKNLRKEYQDSKDSELKKIINKLLKERRLQIKEVQEKQSEDEEQKEKQKNILATYFSVKDNGRTMANGKKFRNADIVAAHSSLPIGTRIKIKSHVTGEEFTATIQDNQPGKLKDCPLVLSKTALVKNLFNNNWDILEEIQKTGTRVEIVVLDKITPDETEKKYLPPKSDAEKIKESETPKKISNIIKTRREIIQLRKEYEESNNPEILEEIKKLQETSKRLSRVQRNRLRTENAEFTAFQTGLATYYSYIFNGRSTANGEIFSNEKMTAAHRTLPIGTNVRVHNTDTKMNVVVRINDRGPYGKQDRVIDLSKEAFAQLYGGDWANLSRGIAPVELYIIP